MGSQLVKLPSNFHVRLIVISISHGNLQTGNTVQTFSGQDLKAIKYTIKLQSEIFQLKISLQSHTKLNSNGIEN
jgi:hypothetical protein